MNNGDANGSYDTAPTDEERLEMLRLSVELFKEMPRNDNDTTTDRLVQYRIAAEALRRARDEVFS